MPEIKLGSKVRDTLTGLEGVAIARTVWIHGCVRITIQPFGLHDGQPLACQTTDENQVEPIPGPVFPARSEGPAGPTPKPSRRSDPR